MVCSTVTRTLALMALPVGLVVYGCADSDGQAGENGSVRFSQVLDYGETDDFTAPIAAGRPIFLALQHPKEGFLDDETYAELTLRVERDDGSEIDAVWPFGFAQYGLRLEDPGDYWLLAERDGVQVDALKVQVQRVDHIVLSDQIQIKTTYDSGTESCSRFEEVDGISQVTLHKNQRLEFFVVPQNSAGEPMLGLLALTAVAPDSVQLDAPLFGQGRRANALSVLPTSALPERIMMSIEDQDSGDLIELDFAASNEDMVLNCD